MRNTQSFFWTLFGDENSLPVLSHFRNIDIFDEEAKMMILEIL